MSKGASSVTSRGLFPVEQNSTTQPFEAGSLTEVVAHLTLWGEAVPDGLALVEYFSETLRDRAVGELARLFGEQQISFHTLELPQNTSSSAVVSFLLEQFRRLPDGVVSLNWNASVFSSSEELDDSLRVLNFYRESLAQFPLRQIWWMPHSFAQHVRVAIPDLYSWFFVRLELTQGRAEGQEPSLPQTEPEGDETQGVFMVPMKRNPYFVGRDALLEKLHAELFDRKNVLLTQAISGLGGIGKTQTACEYAFRYRREYPFVLWTLADSESALDAGYRQIADALKLPERDATEAHVVREAVRRWLGENEGYLLIMDNADSPALVRPFLPERPAGHVLLTSRARNFSALGNVSALRLDVLTRDEAEQFLLRRLFAETAEPSAHEREAVQNLVEELDGLPLALELAAAYIRQQKMDLPTYLRQFRERRVELLAAQGPIQGDYRETVLTTYEPSFRQLQQMHPNTARLLELSAFLAPDAIPFELLLQGGSELGEPLASLLQNTDEGALNLIELLLPAANYSLITVDMDDRSYAMHRMVQAAIQARMDKPASRLCVERLIDAIVEAYPGDDFVYWKQLERLLPHQERLAEEAKQYTLETFHATAMLNQTGGYLHDRANYLEAESFYEKALALRRQALPTGHPAIALSLNNLAELYRAQGRYEEMEPLLMEALAIHRQALPTGHPDIAANLNNLAGLCEVQGRYEEAEVLHKEALAIWQQVLPAGHPDIAISLNNLALLYSNQGRYDEAEPLYEKALAIRKNFLPAGHPLIASSLNNLAALYDSQGRYEEAEPLYEEAVRMARQALGDDHPSTKLFSENFALFLEEKAERESVSAVV